MLKEWAKRIWYWKDRLWHQGRLRSRREGKEQNGCREFRLIFWLLRNYEDLACIMMVCAMARGSHRRHECKFERQTQTEVNFSKGAAGVWYGSLLSSLFPALRAVPKMSFLFVASQNTGWYTTYHLTIPRDRVIGLTLISQIEWRFFPSEIP